MAMKFKTEQNGQMFLVVNESTGYVKGKFKTQGEADVFRDRVQREHNSMVEQASGRLTAPDNGASTAIE